MIDLVENWLKKVNMRPKNLTYLAIGAILLSFFAAILVLETRRVFILFDPAATIFLQKTISDSFDVPLSLFSLLGSVEITAIILLGLFFYLFRKQKILLWSLVLFGVIMGVEVLGKFFLYHPGPPKIFFRYALPFATPEYVSTKYSFPSGHVGRTSFLVVVGLVLIGKIIKGRNLKYLLTFSLVSVLVLMMVSRIYLGEHWVSDVVGGLFLGGGLGMWAMVYF